MRKTAITGLVVMGVAWAGLAHASTTDGTIDTTLKYAWSNNVGWINFSPTNGDVHVTDSRLTGYIWDSHSGSINLAPTNGGVTNDGEGTLGGYAWSTGLGWINFSGVTIDSNGRFHGQATGTSIGILTFDCTHCAVVTDWRPVSVRTPATATPTPAPTGGGGIPSLIGTPPGTPAAQTTATVQNAIQPPAVIATVANPASQSIGLRSSVGTQIGSAAGALPANLFDVQIAPASVSGWNWKPWALGALFVCLAMLCFVAFRRWRSRRLARIQISDEPEAVEAAPIPPVEP